MQNKTNRSIRTDKYRYRHFERIPRTTTHPPRRGGVKDSALAKRDDCNTEANDSAISFARMAVVYPRQKRYRKLIYMSRRKERRRRRWTSQKSSRKSKVFASRSDTGIRRYAQQCPETFMPPAPEPSVRRKPSSDSNPRTPRSGTISRDFMRRKTPAG